MQEMYNTQVWSLGREEGEGNGKPLQYSCLENPMDRGAWQAIVHGVTSVGHALATRERERWIKVYGRIYIGYMQILHHFIEEIQVSVDFSIHGVSGTNSLRILRDDCICLIYEVTKSFSKWLYHFTFLLGMLEESSSFICWPDPLEKGMATLSSILA